MRQIYLLLALRISTQTLAQSSVEVIEINVLDRSFTGVLVEITMEHDGSLGDDVFFGATPVTDSGIHGFSYTPNRLEEGIFSVNAFLSRPNVENQVSFSSHELRFNFYNRTGSVDFDINEELALDWPSFSEYYSVETISGTKDFSITQLEINEAIYQLEPLAQWLGQKGMAINNIKIRSTRQKFDPDSAIPLKVSEDVSFEDLMSLLREMASLGMIVNSLHFYALTDQSVPLGYVSIGHATQDRGKFLTEELYQEIVGSTSPEQLYELAGFAPTSMGEFIESTMARAIAFIDAPYKNNTRRGVELLNVVLEKDPSHVRAYVELARSEMMLNGFEGLAAARNAIRFALNIDKNDAHANHYAGFLEMRQGNYDAALKHYRIAEENRDHLIVWLIVNWGDTFRQMGETEQAIAKYEQLLALSDVDPHNERALYTGLNRYADLLKESNDPRLIAVYEKLFREFPDRSECVPTELAMFLVISEMNTARAREMLDLSNDLECDGHSAVVGLINVVEWHAKQGSQPELFRALVTHNDTGELVYLLSGMRDAPQILGSLVQNGIGLDEPDINGLTPVLNAIYSSNHVALENLAIAGADLNRLDSDNGSALLAAIVNDDEQAVRILLSHKADPALELPYGFSVLGIKDQIENQVIIELLERYSGVSI